MSERRGPTLDYEARQWAAGHRWVAGTDESGRGPLAGPVVAGCVVLGPTVDLEAFAGVDDSKRLTHAQVATLAARLRADVFRPAGLLAWGIGAASVAEIGRLNIRRASVLAMNRACTTAERMLRRHVPRASLEFVLVDGSPAPEFAYPHEAFPRADALSLSVALAAILAKDRRDRHMVRLARRWPAFANLADDKGYASLAHREAIRTHGPIRGLHRGTFTPVVQTSLF